MLRLANLIVRLRLYWAGWRPGRDVWAKLNLPEGLPVFAEARRILGELGDLQFGDPHWEMVRFEPYPPPEVLPHITQFAAQIGRQVYPIGYNEHQDRVFLLIDDEGTVYTLEPSYDPDVPRGQVSRLESSRIEVLSHSFERALWDLSQGRIGYLARRREFRNSGGRPPEWLIES